MKWAVRLYAVLVLWAIFAGIAFHNALVQRQDFSLRLLHTNDHHAHLEAVEVGDRLLGGISRRKTLVDTLRSRSPEPTLLLDAGDIFQGTLYFNQYLGRADLPFYNQMNYAAVAVGNHEFDRGQQPLADFIKEAEFPLVSANLEVDADSPLSGLIEPWIILAVNGQKIGILGLTTEETATLSSPGEGVTFTDPIAAAKEAVQTLGDRGVNKIIALTHLGFNNDLELAKNVGGIDVIIGGHSHTPLGDMPGADEPYPVVEFSPKGDPVLVVTDWEWGKYLGDLQVRFDGRGRAIAWFGSPHPVADTIPADETFNTRLDGFKEPLEKLRSLVIGKTEKLLDGDRAKIRSQETNLGNLIADAVLQKMKPDGGEIAILNGGGIRSSIPAGDVTVGQVIEVLPFGNTIAGIDLTGEQIEQALEHGVSGVEDGEGRFPQVAGIQFTWDSESPAGSRVKSVEIIRPDGTAKPLDPSATYRVITNAFLMNGGDGYEVFKLGKNRVDTGFLMSDVVVDYIRDRSPIQ